MKKYIYNEEKARMNPQFDESVVKMEVFHKDCNLDKKDNLDELPQDPAVFGIFSIIHKIPVHPRYIAATDNLQKAVRNLFENPGGKGMKKFIEGPWIQMLCYDLMKDSTSEERQKKADQWIQTYDPKITDNGEYPKYKYVDPYELVDE